MPPAISFSVWAWGNGYRTQCVNVVGAGRGGIGTRWQGYESSLRVGASEPYIPSAEAVEF